VYKDHATITLAYRHI